MKPAAVFLDRDGVLNVAPVREGKPYPPASVADLTIVSGAAAALARLKAAGYRLVVVTNQPDVAKGRQRREIVEAINAAIAAALPIDEFRVCYHDDGDACACRKPEPGMLLSAPEHELARSVMVGDRWRDVEAGRRAGVRATVLIDHGYVEPMPSAPDARVASLEQAADWILSTDPAPRLRVKLFADGASLDDMAALYRRPYIRGFTTNPTLMRKAGVAHYETFARQVLTAIPDRPISFEVFSDDFGEMELQARAIAGWGPNVYVKIPITNTVGRPARDLIHRLSHDGVKVNVTAILTPQQVADSIDALRGGAPSNVSIFAGRIADTGRDPAPFIRDAVALTADAPGVEIIWASPRELLNLVQADDTGCHIITVTTDLLDKLPLLGRDLGVFSLDTVKMFRDDAVKAGFTLNGQAQSL